MDLNEFDCDYYENKNSSDLVIIMHGSRGNKNHLLQKDLAESLYSKFNIFSFNFPGEISELTFSFEIKYIKKIIKYFKNKFSNIYLIGHSKSASEILCLNEKDYEKLSGCVLIAPRIDLNFSQEVILWGKNNSKDYVYPSNNVHQKITSKYIESVLQSNELIKKFDFSKIPFLVILGTNDEIMNKEEIELFCLNRKNFEFKLIDESDHIFSNPNKRGDMIKLISNWISQSQRKV